MALTSSQYNSIMRLYDERRSNALRIQDEHLEEIRKAIPEYSDLEDEAAGIALDFGRRLIMDPATSLAEMDLALSDITAAKKDLLVKHGYPVSYVEPAYTCPDCQDTGYIENEKCHCFKQAEIKLTYKQSNIHEYFKSQNFSTLREDLFEGDDLIHYQKAVSICHEYINNFDNDNKCLLFCGSVGTGKSFLSGCVAYELLQNGHSVIYLSSSDLFKIFSDNAFNYKGNSNTEDFSSNDDLYECDLLVIDDLGTEIGGQFVNSSLFTCLNERQLRGKSTIISTNLSLSELHDRYSDRVFSRIVGNYTIIKLSGPDLRIKYKDNL